MNPFYYPLLQHLIDNALHKTKQKKNKLDKTKLQKQKKIKKAARTRLQGLQEVCLKT